VTVIEGNNNQTESVRGKIRLVSFTDPQQLQKDGNSNFLAPTGLQPQPAANARLIEGAQEKSNVSGILEMTRMIEISRNYTQIANIIQTQSDLRQTAIGKLANVPS
jgi:flagellar basal body rod protein FlgG